MGHSAQDADSQKTDSMSFQTEQKAHNQRAEKPSGQAHQQGGDAPGSAREKGLEQGDRQSGNQAKGAGGKHSDNIGKPELGPGGIIGRGGIRFSKAESTIAKAPSTARVVSRRVFFLISAMVFLLMGRDASNEVLADRMSAVRIS